MRRSGWRSWTPHKVTEVRNALAAAGARLAGASSTPRLDAELLMAHALGVTREAMLLRHLRDPVPESFDRLIDRRVLHEPTAYILGRRAFWTVDLAVGPGVLIPRPDSETLVEAAVAHFGVAGPSRILDLGTGPGSLLLAALAHWPDARGVGIDMSEVALRYAAANADALGMAERAEFRRGNWTSEVSGGFDLILSNPPYIGTEEVLPPDVARFEPQEALYAGSDGLDAYRTIIPDLRRLLADGGLVALEIGMTQAEAVMALAKDHGFAATLRCDLAGRPRAVLLT